MKRYVVLLLVAGILFGSAWVLSGAPFPGGGTVEGESTTTSGGPWDGMNLMGSP